MVRQAVSLTRAPGASGPLRVTSGLGEDSEHIPLVDCQFDSVVSNAHIAPPAIGVAVSERQLLMYALPDTNVLVSASAACETLSNGLHEVTTTWLPCPVCHAAHDPVEEKSLEDVAPGAQYWTASAAGVETNSNTWTGYMTKGMDQQISFRVVATNNCRKCICEASTNVVVDVHELSISRLDYLGLDRTDAGRTNPVIKAGTAVIDPGPSGTVTYTWTDCGIYSFTGRTDQATVRYFVPDPDVRSGAYPLTVAAAIEDGDLSASATCTTNFTVVKVDVAIAGVDEDKEETEGAFVQYVPDANGAISVEGTNQMKKVAVTFSCAPTNLPTNEVVTIENSGPGQLYEEAGGELVLITATNYPACELSSHKFFLHGHEVPSALQYGEISVTHATSGAKDVAKYKNVKLRVTNIKFNHDTSSSSRDAINIRRSFADGIDVSRGEWLEVGGVVTNEPFCYTTNRRVTVMARFEASSFITSAVIRATCAGAAGSLSGLLPTNVVFSGGVSSPEYVEFKMERSTLACIDRSEGALAWSADSVNGQSGCKMNGSGPHIVYTILGEPKPPWDNAYPNEKNAWTNALEFAIVKAGAAGKDKDKDALAAVTTYLHGGHGLMYDTVRGAPRYWDPTTGVFSATAYISVTNSVSVTNLVNCYDQAHGVVTLGNLLGPTVNAIPRYTMPFGYINTTDLVGVGSCNNPFFNTTNEVNYIDNVTSSGIVSYSSCMPPTNRVCGVDDKKRSSFSNHMYAILNNGGTNYVFDACAGPVVGNLDRDAYLNMTIDHSTSDERLLGFYTTLSVRRIDQGLPASFPLK